MDMKTSRRNAGRGFTKLNRKGLLPLVCFLITVAGTAIAQGLDTPTFLQILQAAQTKSDANDWQDAAGLWEQVVKMNPVDPDYWRQWALALYQLKEYRQAIAANEKSLELGSPTSDFPWSVAYDIARNYALIGDSNQALKWLDKSWHLGFRNLKSAREDNDLKSLRDNQHFRDLTAFVDVSKMNRTDGWRYDLHLLGREIKRRHYDPFRVNSRQKFDASIQALNGAIPTLSDNQIAVRLMKIIAMVNDGHSLMVGFSGLPRLRKSVPLRFYLFEEGLFIISADAAHTNLLGSQVMRIGGHTVEEVMSAISPIVGRENSMRLKAVAPGYMRCPPILNGLGLLSAPDSLPLTLRDSDGQVRKVTVAANSDGLLLSQSVTKDWISLPETTGLQLPLRLKNPYSPYWFEYHPDTKMLYFQFNQVADKPGEPFDKFVERMFTFIREHEVAKLVIDMRENRGGNTFLVKPLIHALIRDNDLSQAGKLFVVIGRTTFSAAMNTVDFIERNTNVIFVGEPTGSSPNFIGETAPVMLPYSKLEASISDLYWESAWPMDHRIWTAPLLYTPATFAAYRDNDDPALDAIIAYK
jgi:hypothetical protein